MSCCTGSSAYKTEEAACEVQPAVLVNSIRAQHPSKSRQGVAGMAQRLLVEEEATSNCADYPPKEPWIGGWKSAFESNG